MRPMTHREASTSKRVEGDAARDRKKTGPAAAASTAILQLQRRIGNRAVTRLLGGAGRVVQRAVRLFGADGDQQAFVDLVNGILSGRYILRRDPQGVLSLEAGPRDEISETGRRFHTMLAQMIGSSRQTSLRIGRGIPGGTIASFQDMTLDIQDISAFGGPGMAGASAASVLMHEMWEQYHSQGVGMEYEAAHAQGIVAEEYVSGMSRIGDTVQAVDEGRRRDLFLYASDDRVVLVEAFVENDRIVMVRRHDVTAPAERWLSRNLPRDLVEEHTRLEALQLLRGQARDLVSAFINVLCREATGG
jgi:hypothetical protein